MVWCSVLGNVKFDCDDHVELIALMKVGIVNGDTGLVVQTPMRPSRKHYYTACDTRVSATLTDESSAR